MIQIGCIIALIILIIIIRRFAVYMCESCGHKFHASESKIKVIIPEYLYHEHCPKCDHYIGAK